VAALDEDRRRAWLFTVARNLVVDTYRSRSSSAAREITAFADAETTAPPADAGVGPDEAVREMDRAIARLPEALREVLVLHVLGDRNSTEIGTILGRPPGTVRYQLAEARRLLARALEIE
jgi:RNA polymerase sigma-70 factor (ECF subfamily)